MSVVKGRGRSGDVRAVLDINPEAEVSVSREVLTGVTIAPRVIETAAGKAEFDLTEGESAVVLTSMAASAAWIRRGSYWPRTPVNKNSVASDVTIGPGAAS